MPGTLLLVLLAAGASEVPPGPAHSVALVNDPRSHGQVGDSLLSLNEVILINKRALAQSSLSAQEQKQILGFGPDVAFADLDFSVVPKITLERDLDVVADTPHGLVISGSNGTPVIDLNDTRGFVLDSDFADVRNVVLENADVAITSRQRDAVFGNVFENVTFRDVRKKGIVASFADDDGSSWLQIESCRFESVPLGVEVLDVGARRTGELQLLDTHFSGGNAAMTVDLGADGSLRVTIERTHVEGAGIGIAFTRSGGGTRRLDASALHLRATGTTTALSAQDAPGAATALTFRMCELTGTTSALDASCPGTDLDLLFEDGRLAGTSTVLGGSTGSVALHNVEAIGGRLEVGSAGAPVTVRRSFLRDVAVSSLGSTPVQVDNVRLEGGGVAGRPGASVRIRSSYLAASAAIGAHVSVSTPLAAPQLGSMDVSPLDPAPGSTVALRSDLPPGLSGVWVVGLAETFPFLGPQPLHLYFWLTAHVVLPGTVRGRSTVNLPLPNNAYLSGWDFVVQLAVVPDPGMQAPLLSLPPGRRFVVQ